MKRPKHACPYCGRRIKLERKACAAHYDLLRLDEEQTGWTPK